MPHAHWFTDPLLGSTGPLLGRLLSLCQLGCLLIRRRLHDYQHTGDTASRKKRGAALLVAALLRVGVEARDSAPGGNSKAWEGDSHKDAQGARHQRHYLDRSTSCYPR